MASDPMGRSPSVVTARAVPRMDRRPLSECGRLGSLDFSADQVSCDRSHLQACRVGLVTGGHCGWAGAPPAWLWTLPSGISPFTDADSGGTPSWSHHLSFPQPSSLLFLFSSLRPLVSSSCPSAPPHPSPAPVSQPLSSVITFSQFSHSASRSHPTLLNGPWSPYFLFRFKKMFCMIFKGYFQFIVITEYWLYSPFCTYILEPVLHPVVCISPPPT